MISGQIDVTSLETKSALEIYDAVSGTSSPTPRLLGQVTVKDAFSSIAWGTSTTHGPLGLIAGGMVDGCLNLWSADAILKASTPAGATAQPLARADLHKGAVNAIEFHPSHTTLLASGGSDGEVMVWDLSNVAEPKATRPAAGGKASPAAVRQVAWHPLVLQLLASSTDAGETTIWDLRQKRSIATFRPSSHVAQRTSGLVCGDDVVFGVSYFGSPVAEIWDLRNAMKPMHKLQVCNVHARCDYRYVEMQTWFTLH